MLYATSSYNRSHSSKRRTGFVLNRNPRSRSVKLCFPTGKVDPDYKWLITKRDEDDKLVFWLSPHRDPQSCEQAFRFASRDPDHAAEVTITKALHDWEIDALTPRANQINVVQTGLLSFKLLTIKKPAIPGLTTPRLTGQEPAPAPAPAPAVATFPVSDNAIQKESQSAPGGQLSPLREALKNLNRELSKDPRLMIRTIDGRSAQIFQRIDW